VKNPNGKFDQNRFLSPKFGGKYHLLTVNLEYNPIVNVGKKTLSGGILWQKDTAVRAAEGIPPPEAAKEG
jgi:hypothetical protein